MNTSSAMRVELIVNPELKGLTRKEIERFREDYQIYKEKVEAQGEDTKPVSKYMCIPHRLRRSIGNQIGIRYANLTPQLVWQKLDGSD